MSNSRRTATYVVIMALIGLIYSCGNSHAPAGKDPGKLSIFVSILPQKHFVERIGGNLVSVRVLVEPGQSPATYEPTSRQMFAMSEAHMYIRIGVPFERNWLKKIRKTNLSMKILNCATGVDRRIMETPFLEVSDDAGKRRGHHALHDPHIWLNPGNVKVIAENIYKALSNVEPSSESYFRENLESFKKSLDNLDKEIREILEGIPQRTCLVFHPSWGYFADAYGLIQLPIEIEGKEASTKELVMVIDRAKKENIKTVFVQEQFSRKQAESIAREIGGQVVALDPLAEDYEANLKHVAQTLAGNMKE